MSATEAAPSIPFTLPRNAKPSELVRSLAPEHWTTGAYKRICQDGSAQWCAAGIIAEHMGARFLSGGDEAMNRLDDQSECEMESLLGAGLHLVGRSRFAQILTANDDQGKDAAADLLESWGL